MRGGGAFPSTSNDADGDDDGGAPSSWQHIIGSDVASWPWSYFCCRRGFKLYECSWRHCSSCSVFIKDVELQAYMFMTNLSLSAVLYLYKKIAQRKKSLFTLSVTSRDAVGRKRRG